MYQYFERQLRTPTCFGSFGIRNMSEFLIVFQNIDTCRF